MQVLGSIDELPAGLRFAATIGVFDGVHRGHAAVLRSLLDCARDVAACSLVITFTPHPDAVVRDGAPPALTHPAERLAHIARAGVELAVVQPFDRAFAAQPPAAFLERLARGRDLAGLVMSAESAFGRDRAGTIDAARAVAEAEGFRLAEAPVLALGGERVTSSRIRAAIETGRLAVARRLLGRHHAVIGTVVHGDRRGRDLGYPTANLAFDETPALPPNGIYAVRVGWGGEDPLRPAHRRDGVASLGVRPTFGGGHRLLEVHLFDFDGDLYDRLLRVELVRRQRGERRFPSAEALIRQMDADCARARTILAASERSEGSDRDAKPNAC